MSWRCGEGSRGRSRPRRVRVRKGASRQRGLRPPSAKGQASLTRREAEWGLFPWAEAHGYRQITATRYGGSRTARRILPHTPASIRAASSPGRRVLAPGAGTARPRCWSAFAIPLLVLPTRKVLIATRRGTLQTFGLPLPEERLEGILASGYWTGSRPSGLWRRS